MLLPVDLRPVETRAPLDMDAHLPLGELAALATAGCWAASSLAFTVAARRRGASLLNLFRLCLATVVLGGLVVAVAEPVSPEPRQLIALCASGWLGLVLGDLALFQAFHILGARRAMLLMALAPVLTAILAIPLLDEPLGLRGVIGMLVTLLGIAWVQFERDDGTEVQGSLSWGLVLGVLAAAGQATGLVVAKLGLGSVPDTAPLAQWVGVTSPEPVEALTGTFVRMAASVLVLVPLALLTGMGRGIREAVRDRGFLTPALIGTALGPVVGVWLSLVAVGRADAAVAATIIATAPALVIPLAYVVHRRGVSMRALLGTLLTLVGVAILIWRG